MSKKSFLCLLMTIFLSFSFTACKSSSELTTINLNEVVHSIFYAPQYVAIEKGFFREEGLEIKLSVGQGADKSMTALISGDAHIALLGTEAGIYVYNEGRENYAVAFAQLKTKIYIKEGCAQPSFSLYYAFILPNSIFV